METTSLLNMGTISSVYALASVAFALILGVLWHETGTRYRGPGFWMAGSIAQAVGLGLLLLRGFLPPVLSVVLSNTLLAAALLLIRLGFARFTGTRTSLVVDIAVFPLFVAGMMVFSYVRPDTGIRTLLVSAVFLLLACEGVVVLHLRARQGLRPITLWPGAILALHALASMSRIVLTIVVPRSVTENWFESPASQAVFLLVYFLINLGLVFALFLMVTRRMRADEHDLETGRHMVEEALRESESRQVAVFRTSPLGMLISHFPDGRVRDVNDAFLNLIGRKREEVIERLTSELAFWADPSARSRFIGMLADTGHVRDAECVFRTGSGEFRDASLNMELVEIDGDKFVLLLASDITERKGAERDRERMIVALKAALAEVKTLSGLIPICASCKKVRDDAGYWHQVETYLAAHSDMEFTHGLCPDCLRRLYPEIAAEVTDAEKPS